MKRAIVFGATGGIGSSICEDLAKDGWSLYLHTNSKWNKAYEKAIKLANEYPSQDFLPVKLDFNSSDAELKKFVDGLIPVNAVIFAQGITDYNFVGTQKMTMMDKIININLTVPIKLTHLLEDKLVKQEFSRIIYLGSVYGGQGSAMEAVYSATEAGLSRFSQAYAREVVSTNLTVNVLAPGAVDTPMNAMFSEETIAEVTDEIPIGRFASGKDISYWVKVILNPQSGYLTGQTIYISGGWLL